MASIKSRRGQSKFREVLLSAYDRTCCISGSKVISVLEAAHIFPHADKTDYSVTNGLLLRADIHTLFDLGLIYVSEDGVVGISRYLYDTEYEQYEKVAVLTDIPVAMANNLAARLSKTKI